jgi:hypothetical protein
MAETDNKDYMDEEKYLNDLKEMFYQLSNEIIDKTEIVGDIKSEQIITEVFNTRIKKS